MRPLPLGVAVLIGGLGLVSCSGQVHQTQDWEAVIEAIQKVDLVAVETDLRAECMAANGFTFDHRSSAVKPPETFNPIVEFGDDTAAREVAGTGLIYGTLQSLTSPVDEPVAYPSIEYETAMWDRAEMGGTAIQGGCVKWAQDEIAHHPRLRAAQELAVIYENAQEVENVPEMAAAWQAWSGCMAEQGFSDLATRSDLFELVSGWKHEAFRDSASDADLVRRLEALLPRDRDLARADGECSEHSGVDDLARRLSDEQMAAIVAEHHQMIREIAERIGVDAPPA